MILTPQEKAKLQKALDKGVFEILTKLVNVRINKIGIGSVISDTEYKTIINVVRREAKQEVLIQFIKDLEKQTYGE